MNLLRSAVKEWYTLWATRPIQIDKLRILRLPKNETDAAVNIPRDSPNAKRATESNSSMSMTKIYSSETLNEKLVSLPKAAGMLSPGLPKLYLFGGHMGENEVQSLKHESSCDRAQVVPEVEKTQVSNPQSFGVVNVRSNNYIRTRKSMPDLSMMEVLIASRNERDCNQNIEHAPLLSEHIVMSHAGDLVRQYGFLGCMTDGVENNGGVKVFQNTNVPFSAFICGVQGSGKSHTTACMLENALIPSKQLGHLEAPASALVFSYGKGSRGSGGFDISEVTHLAVSDAKKPGHKVDNVTVLVSPSNLAIHKKYRSVPRVRVIPFKLNPRALNIEALRKLMGFDDKEAPLYQAKVESIFRDIASKSKGGCLEYTAFKSRLRKEKFDTKQRDMLKMRLDLLESFLDMSGKAVEPQYRAGELTIIDLTDPFVTPSTACVLFKIGLDQFLQSSVKAKMVVLDEAHKYMLSTPGSKFLTDRLSETIRLQRHEGARVIISTQEPTVSTELIALCSINIIHRFTSPAWYKTLKMHINVMGNDDEIKKQIEKLETGEALVYAPSTIMSKDGKGNLIKAPSRLFKLNIRKRITRDGGKSIMAL